MVALGQALARARRSGSRVATGAGVIDSLAAAELVQDLATLAYDRPIEGYVLAATTTLCARLLNCETPLVSPMYASNAIDDGGTLAVASSMLGIGVDLVFRFGRPFPVRDDDAKRLDQIRDAVVDCRLGLQVLGRRFTPEVRIDTWTATADFGLASHHVRGDSLTNWRDLDLRTLPMSLGVDGHRLAVGTGGDALGDPIACLGWLARRLANRGSYIEAGRFVAIGSCTGLIQLAAGHTIQGGCGTGDQVSLITR